MQSNALDDDVLLPHQPTLLLGESLPDYLSIEQLRGEFEGGPGGPGGGGSAPVEYLKLIN